MLNEGMAYLATLVSAALLFVLVFWFYRQLVLDRFRQRMFALRDEMFDDACNGTLDFSMPAYQLLRQTMNGMIRMGHRMNLLFAILLTVVRTSGKQPPMPSFEMRLTDAMRGLPTEQQSTLLAYQRRMDAELARYLVVSSPVFNLTVIMPIVVLVAMKRHAVHFARILRQPVDRINRAAYAAARE